MSNQSNLSIQTFEGYPIAFDFSEGHRHINLTQMAKPFGKVPHSFLRSNQTKEFINELGHFANLRSEKVVLTINGGDNPGTWGHELLALKFAGWLSPRFELWMMERIRELLTGAVPQLESDLAPLQRLVEEAAPLAGSRNKLAIRIGISPGTLTSVMQGQRERLSDEMKEKIMRFCQWYVESGYQKETLLRFRETMDQLITVEDGQTRMKLYAQFVHLLNLSQL